MSHFTVLVITDHKSNCVEKTFEKTVEKLLAPYYEGNEVPEYDSPCYCIGGIALRDTQQDSDSRFGSWDTLRNKFYNDISPKPTKPWDQMTDEEMGAYHDLQDKAWKEFVKEKSQYEHDVFERHPLKDKPENDCEECKGKGTYRSTYNPKSKWDWYVIGGRWDGACHEDGKNIFKAGELKDTTFAVITPDGEWHERGKMGWFAIVKNEDGGWDTKCKELVAQYSDNYAVLVDCHI